MINPFTFILIALMDRVYADIAWLIVRARFTPLAYGCSFRACLSQGTTLPLISLGDSQVVQVRDRDTRQPSILILAKAPIRSLTELFKYRAVGLTMSFIHTRQHAYIELGISPLEAIMAGRLH